MGSGGAVGIASVSLLVVVIALAAVSLSKQYDGGAKQSCPVFSNDQYMYLGKVAEKGEPCGYLSGGTAPRCMNAVLNLPLRDEEDRSEDGDLACFKNTCIELLLAGEDCGMPDTNGNVVGAPHACVSGVCVQKDTPGEWRCEATHSQGDNATCAGNDYCRHEDWCSAGHCVPRTELDQACTMVDDHTTTLPGPHESIQCTAGLLCTNIDGTPKCLRPDYGSEGTPCPWDASSGDARPQCLRGNAFCAAEGVCHPLLEEGARCSTYLPYGFADSIATCAYGLGCHPDSKPDVNDTWVEGTCTSVHSIPEGGKAFFEGYCKWGLYLNPVTDMCMESAKVDQSCSNSAECDSSSLDTGRALCMCSDANGLGGPGKCKKAPLTHPAVTHLKYPERCSSQFQKLTTYLDQFWKIADLEAMDEDAREKYDEKVQKYQTEGYCCLKNVKHTSHMWFMTGMFAVDLDQIELRCNTDLIWLWVVIGVIGLSICIGICAILLSMFGKEEVAPSESNLPFGSETDDVVAELIHKTSLDTGRRHSQAEFPLRSATSGGK